MSWWLLAILYGLAGFGYHRRDLPAAHGERCRLTIVNRPSLDVSRLINCAWLLWLAMGSKTLGGFALPDGEFAGAGYLCAAYSRQRLASLAYHQQSWFWRSTGTHISGDDYRPPTERTGNLNLLGFVTLIYGIGQILGPR